MREEDEIRAAVIELARAQAAGEDIADALPHGEALATAGAAADGEVADDALDPEQARREAILAVLDVVRAASRESLLSCPCEWEAAGLVPPSMMPEDLEMAVYDALMEFGDPNGSREAAGVGGPDAGAAPRRAANKHVKSAFSSSNGRPVGASPFKHKKPRADDPAMGDVQGAGGCPDRASSAATGTAQWAVPPSEPLLKHGSSRLLRGAPGDASSFVEYDRLSSGGNGGGVFVALYSSRLCMQSSAERICPMSSTIPGNLHVANDVLADLVGNAAMECYGVVGVCAPNAADSIAKILPASRLRRGVVVSSTEAGVHVELYVVIEYGTNISAVSQNLVDQVTFALKEYARVPLDGVEVHVQGVKVRK